MGFFVLGISHKQCPVEIRERLHFSAKVLPDFLKKARQQAGFSEMVVLSTCNRVELYGFTEQSPVPQERLLKLIEETHGIGRAQFEGYLYQYEGREALRHIFRVAAGLDSLVVGENEILGQLREAFRTASDARSIHSLLYRLMEKTLKVGKDVRTATKINEGAVSIPSVAVELAEKIFGRLAGEKVMVLGTGEMSALTLKSLKGSGAEAFYVVSRSQARGEKLAAEFGAQWVPLESWENYLGSVDILIASTAAPHPVVHFDQVERVMKARRHRPLFLIDIAVPRNIEPRIDSLADVYLYNIDDLKGVADANLRLRRSFVRDAEALVEKAVLGFQAWLEQLTARPTLERFENFLNEILERELAAFAGETGASEEKKNQIRERIRAKLLHPPLSKIKEASMNGGVTRYLEALHSLFDL